MNSEYMISKKVLSNPKIMALSGLLAMVPKGIVTGVLAFSLGLFLNKSHFWPLCFVLYPMVGTFCDILLHCFKNTIWKTLPAPSSIPEDWKIMPEQLLQFAKQLPKVRLMRFVGCLVGLPFMLLDNKFNFSEILSSMVTGYFICALFDVVWLKVLNIKRPEYIVKYVNRAEYLNDTEDLEKVSRLSDASSPGSPAWFSQQSFNESSRR